MSTRVPSTNARRMAGRTVRRLRPTSRTPPSGAWVIVTSTASQLIRRHVSADPCTARLQHRLPLAGSLLQRRSLHVQHHLEPIRPAQGRASAGGVRGRSRSREEVAAVEVSSTDASPEASPPTPGSSMAAWAMARSATSPRASARRCCLLLPGFLQAIHAPPRPHQLLHVGRRGVTGQLHQLSPSLRCPRRLPPWNLRDDQVPSSPNDATEGAEGGEKMGASASGGHRESHPWPGPCVEGLPVVRTG